MLGSARFGFSGGAIDAGKLELIQTQTYSSAVSFVDFTSLGDYNVHFMTLNNIQGTNDSTATRFYFYEGGTLESASVYQWARQIVNTAGGSTEQNDTSRDGITLFGTNDNDTNHKNNGYAYFYNLKDSSEYSFCTFQSGGEDYYETGFHFGSAVLPQASEVDGIRFAISGGNYSSFNISLYGIAES